MADKIMKVQVKIRLQNGKYKTVTDKEIIPCNEHGFTLTQTLHKNLCAKYQSIPGFNGLVWHRVVS